MRSADIKFNLDQISYSGDWALEIKRAAGERYYINLPRGVEIFDSKKFEKNGISLRFLKPYNESIREFLPSLSITDALMFNSPKGVYKMLMQDYHTFSQPELVSHGG